jgi:3-phosphoinositide dependent protein kinase-1
MTNQYPGESQLNDMSSAIHSPASTLGADSHFDGSKSNAKSKYRQEHGDSESLKVSKRFSKRHSKNELAAVF